MCVQRGWDSGPLSFLTHHLENDLRNLHFPHSKIQSQESSPGDMRGDADLTDQKAGCWMHWVRWTPSRPALMMPVSLEMLTLFLQPPLGPSLIRNCGWMKPFVTLKGQITLYISELAIGSMEEYKRVLYVLQTPVEGFSKCQMLQLPVCLMACVIF